MSLMYVTYNSMRMVCACRDAALILFCSYTEFYETTYHHKSFSIKLQTLLEYLDPCMLISLEGRGGGGGGLYYERMCIYPYLKSGGDSR